MTSRAAKWGVLIAVAGIFAILYWNFGQKLNLTALAKHEAELREYQADHPILVYGAAFLIYVVSTGLSLPGAAVLTLAYGWYFGGGTLAGYFKTLLLISFASTAGATLAFLLSRYLFRDLIQNRFGKRLQTFNTALEKQGAFYLFSLRLIPAVPFFVVNLVMGLTTMRVVTYWWVSQLGMLAGTAVYVYAGWSFPTLARLAERGPSGILTPQLWLAFVLLGVFPLLVRTCMARFRTVPE